MTRRFNKLAFLGLAAAAVSMVAVAQKRVPVSTAENQLVGIKLFASGSTVISRYGSPLQILPIGFGGQAIGPAGGAGGGGPRGGGPGGPSGGGVPSAATDVSITPIPPGGFEFGDDFLRQMSDDSPKGGGRGGATSGPSPAASGGGAAPGGGGAGAGGGSGARVEFTRWVYKRGTSKYGFILNKQNKVVQIEAIGLSDGRVRTRRGITFGAQFKDIIKRYGDPDGYEINGDSIVVRYLQRHKCAFRLNRLGKDKPHQVTGIVVAGGKD